MTQIFTTEQIKEAIVLNANQLISVVLINHGSGQFVVRELPVEAQSSPVYGIEIADLDGVGKQDILLGGNLYRAKPEVGRYDASYGTYLKGEGAGNFSYVSAKESGIKIDGEVRDILSIKSKNENLLLISRNNDKTIAFKRHRK